MYFDRVFVKENSKARLKGSDYWTAVAVSLIAGLIAGGVSGGSFNYSFDDSDLESLEQFLEERFSNMAHFATTGDVDSFLYPFLAGVVVLVIVAMLFAWAYQIFCGNVIGVGTAGWFMCFARGESPSFGTMFGAFKFYGRAMTTMLLRSIYTFLWSLLFIIPGIVKGIAYSMTPYILCDNPNLTASQAIALSERMTDGYKGELFIMDWSFVGWNLLNALTFGILGIFYTNPYMRTAYAGAYLHLKQLNIQSGRLSPADFGDPLPAPAPEVSYEAL